MNPFTKITINNYLKKIFLTWEHLQEDSGETNSFCWSQYRLKNLYPLNN